MTNTTEEILARIGNVAHQMAGALALHGKHDYAREHIAAIDKDLAELRARFATLEADGTGPGPCGHKWDRTLHLGCPRCAITGIELLLSNLALVLIAAEAIGPRTYANAGDAHYYMREKVREALALLAGDGVAVAQFVAAVKAFSAPDAARATESGEVTRGC